MQTVRALGKMRFNKTEVAALALGQPLHKFEKNGVLFMCKGWPKVKAGTFILSKPFVYILSDNCMEQNTKFCFLLQTVRALGKMRFNKTEVAALALGQPSHKFEKEGVLFVREKQEGFFRRSESKYI